MQNLATKLWILPHCLAYAPNFPCSGINASILIIFQHMILMSKPMNLAEQNPLCQVMELLMFSFFNSVFYLLKRLEFVIIVLMLEIIFVISINLR